MSDILAREVANLVYVSIWVSCVGFFALGVLTLLTFRSVKKDTEKISAIQAAIFLYMRQTFSDFDRKMDELLRRAE